MSLKIYVDCATCQSRQGKEQSKTLDPIRKQNNKTRDEFGKLFLIVVKELKVFSMLGLDFRKNQTFTQKSWGFGKVSCCQNL